MAKIAKLQKEVDGVLNTIYPSTITEAVINIESSKSLKDELTDINNRIPTKTSDITNDSGYITKGVSDLTNYSTTDTVNQAINNAVSSKVDISSISTVATSGDYNDLNNKPVIPSSTSELTNDSNYITSSEVDTKINSVEAALATKLDSSAYTAATSTTSGYMSSEDYIKLSGIEENADVNIIEAITVNGDVVSITDKTAAIEVNETHGVLLDEVPTDTTLTYQDGDKVKSFTIGMTAIYPDSDTDEGYSASMLLNIVDSKAIWKSIGGMSALPSNIYLASATTYDSTSKIINQGILN